MTGLIEYDRTLVGYHGTRRSAALRIVQGLEPFTPSDNDDDWLGHGIYFWEHGPRQARAWARRRSRQQDWGEDVAVLAALIRLRSCFDLFDPPNVRDLEGYHAEFCQLEATAGRPLPVNVRNHKRLDCAVFEFAYSLIESRTGEPVDSSRAMYVPTGQDRRVWPHSWIARGAHIQICVRNRACILGAWLVPSTGEEDES